MLLRQLSYAPKDTAQGTPSSYKYLHCSAQFYPPLRVQIAEELPAEILQEYKDIFSYFDRDGGGSIGAEEFDQVMRTFGWEPKDEELKEMVSVIDQDGDGTISFNEFVWLMTR